MHCVLLGVVKTLMKLWPSSSFNKEQFSISKSLPEVEKLLKNIHPPNIICRARRSTEDHLKYFKVSELIKKLSSFYGLVILKGKLPSPYYEHFFFMFSEAIHLLLPLEITEQHLQQASVLFTNFCANIKLLYGKCYRLANCHRLLHLVESVRQLGPLWTHSCFHFEDANGFIL